MSDTATATTKQVVRFYWQYASKYPRHLAGAFISSPLAVLTNQYLPPLILANALRRLSTHDYVPNQVWQSFGPDIVLYVALQFGSSLVLWRALDWFVWRLEGNVQKDIANSIFAKLTTQSANFHADRFSGSLVSQSNKAITSYIRIADSTIFSVVPLFFSIVFACFLVYSRSRLFVLCLVLFSIFYVISAIFITRHTRKIGAVHSRAESKQTGHLADAITNMMAIKSFSGEDFEKDRFEHATEHTREKLFKIASAVQKQMAYFSSSSATILSAAFVVAIISVVNLDADVATVF